MARNPFDPHLGTHLTPIVYPTAEGTKLSRVFELDSEEHDNWNGAPDDRLCSLGNGPWGNMVFHQPVKAHLIHSCCWLLLTRHFANDEIDLDRLYEVCRNRPMSRTESYLGSSSQQFSDVVRNLQHPLLRPVIRGIGDATKQISKIQRLNLGAGKSILFGADPFGLLPMEVRLEIAAYLPTADFLDLRSVSRMMALVFSLQSFWRTRFRINGDRGFLAFLTDDRSKRKNWRSIYHCTAKIETLYLHEWSMRRQWRNSCWLRDRYSMTPTPGGQIESEHKLPSEVAWRTAAAELGCERARRNILPSESRPPCVCYQGEVIPMLKIDLMPGHIGLTVFILKEGTSTGITTHIIGFDLISGDVAPNITLGYRLPGSQVTIDLSNRRLRGFKVIADDRGLRALRPVFNDNIMASWIGVPEEDERTNSIQILSDINVKHIAAEFDVSLSHGSGSEYTRLTVSVLQDGFFVYRLDGPKLPNTNLFKN